MSYYTYFYPKDYNKDNLSEEDINNRVVSIKETIDCITLRIKLSMIEFYYGEKVDSHHTLEGLFKNIVFNYQEKEKLEQILWINEEIKQYQCVGINHADCSSKYYLQEQIDSRKKDIKECFSFLCCLAVIKPFYYIKNEEEKSRKETEYLKTEYLVEIDNIINNVVETIEETCKLQFMLNYFDTKKEESKQ